MHSVSAYLHHLNPPASESALQALEQHFGVTLPPAFKAYYRHHDGQSALEDWQPGETRWLPLEEIISTQARWQQFVVQHFGAVQRLDGAEMGVQSALFHPLWLPFMEDSDGSLYCLDFAPTADGDEGQVIFIGLSEDLARYDVIYESPDFASWLNDLLSAYQQEDFEPELPALCADYWQQELHRAPETLNPPVGQSALQALQRRLRYPLPEALQTLYRLFNGQHEHSKEQPNEHPNARFLPVETMSQYQQQLLELVQSAFGEHWVDANIDNGAHIQKLPYHPLWLPFYEEAGGKALWCYDPVPGADGVIGQVIRLDVRTFQSALVAEDMHEALSQLLRQLLSPANEQCDD